jgi:hypothetical protein
MELASLEPVGINVVSTESAQGLGIANTRPKILLLDDAVELQVMLEL